MRLTELRRARELSQAKLAEILKTDQGNISRMEQRADMYISTLRKYVEAVGGSLDIVAHFPGGSVRISQFGDLRTEAMEHHKSIMEQFDSVFDQLSK